MERIKHTLVTRWKLLFVIAVLVPGVLTLLAMYPPMSQDGKVDSTSVAAWVQGVGTVLAVLAAAWIARDQFDWQQRAELQRRREAHLLELQVIRDVLLELHYVVREAHIAASDTDAEYDRFFASAGVLDMHAFNALLHLLFSAPLSTHHGPTLFIEIHKAKFAAEKSKALLELLRKYADASPRQPRLIESVNELGAHRGALSDVSKTFVVAVKTFDLAQ